jgi:hypothetical protein
MVQSFREQAKYWLDNGFVEDLLSIKGNIGQFLKDEDLTKFLKQHGLTIPNAKSKDCELAPWSAVLQESEVTKILQTYINTKMFDQGWLGTGNTAKKDAVLWKAHISCADRWKRSSTKRHPIENCAWCELLQPGAKVPAEHVDHIIPFSFFPKFDGEAWNFQGLCEAHNSVKSNFPLPIQIQMEAEDLKDRIWGVLGL